MPQANKFLVSSFPISISPIKLKLKINLKFFWFFVFLIIFSLLIISIYQLNLYTSEIYFIHNYEKKINQLSLENKVLEIDLAKANSLGNIGNYVQNFEKVDRIEYIRILEGTVLAK